MLEKKSTIPLTIGNSYSSAEKLDNQSITDKIDSITNNCSKKYFKKALCTLAGENPTNAAAICDYLMAEETENNIKQSTKEGISNINCYYRGTNYAFYMLFKL